MLISLPEYLQQLEPSRNGGARPDPPQRLTSSSPGLPHSPSPRAEGAQTQPGGQRGRPAGQRLFSQSRAYRVLPASLRRGSGRPPGTPPAPRTPLIAYFHTFCMARLTIWMVLILCTSCGLLLGDCKSEIW